MKVLLLCFVLVLLVRAEDSKSWRSIFVTKALDLRNFIMWKARHPLTSRDAPKRPPKASCGTFTRASVVDCFDKIADLNCDYKLTASEIDSAVANHLSYFERAVLWVATSSAMIMQGCDKNKDGFIDHNEFLNQYEGCMNKESEICHVRDICVRELQGARVCGR